MRLKLRGASETIILDLNLLQSVSKSTEPGAVCAVHLYSVVKHLDLEQARVLQAYLYSHRPNRSCPNCYVFGAREQACSQLHCQLRAVAQPFEVSAPLLAMQAQGEDEQDRARRLHYAFLSLSLRNLIAVCLGHIFVGKWERFYYAAVILRILFLLLQRWYLYYYYY